MHYSGILRQGSKNFPARPVLCGAIRRISGFSERRKYALLLDTSVVFIHCEKCSCMGGASLTTLLC